MSNTKTNSSQDDPDRNSAAEIDWNVKVVKNRKNGMTTTTRRSGRHGQEDPIILTASYLPSSVVSIAPYPVPVHPSLIQDNDVPFVPYSEIGKNQASGYDLTTPNSCKSSKTKHGRSKTKSKSGRSGSLSGTDARSGKGKNCMRKSGHRTTSSTAGKNAIPAVAFTNSQDQGVVKDRSEPLECNNHASMNSSSSSSSCDVNALPSILKMGDRDDVR